MSAGKAYLVIFFFSFFIACSHSQDLKYARSVIDTLSSENMHGRGYVNDGNNIAASYILSQFSSFKLNAFSENYLQNFSHPVNTFPSKVDFIVDSIRLFPGKDFIVNPSCPQIRGNYKVRWAADTLKTISKKRGLGKKDEILIFSQDEQTIDARYTEHIIGANRFKAIVILKDKLTWGISCSVGRVPVIEVRKDLFPENAKKIYLNIENKYVQEYTTGNVIGYIEGSLFPDSFIVFSAHYDHLGKLGSETIFPGANDNASGIAMLLNLAQHYSKKENKPRCSIAFIAFAAEEAGLLGSKYFIQNPLFPLEKIKLVMNFDILGTGEEGITVVNATKHQIEFDLLVEINKEKNYLNEIKSRGPAAISDHHYFSEKNIKAFYIYTLGGIKSYHDIYDRAATLSLFEFEDVFRLFTSFVRSLEIID